jgi:hypothetical protein
MNILSREIRILNEDRQEADRRMHRRWKVAAVTLAVILISCVIGATLAFAGDHIMLVCS